MHCGMVVFCCLFGGHRRGHTYIFKQSQHVLDFPKIVINSHDQGVVSFLEYDMDMGNLWKFGCPWKSKPGLGPENGSLWPQCGAGRCRTPGTASMVATARKSTGWSWCLCMFPRNILIYKPHTYTCNYIIYSYKNYTYKPYIYICAHALKWPENADITRWSPRVGRSLWQKNKSRLPDSEGLFPKKTLGNIGDESKLILYNLGSHMEGMYIIAVIFVGCDFLQRQGAARFYVGLPYPQVALDNDISSTNHT